MGGCLRIWFFSPDGWGTDDREWEPGDAVRVQAGAERGKVLMGREERGGHKVLENEDGMARDFLSCQVKGVSILTTK